MAGEGGGRGIVPASNLIFLIFVFVGVSIFLLLSTSRANAGDIEDARNALDRRDYKVAFKLFDALAHRGNAEAQCYLGYLYGVGAGVDKDIETSIQWYQKSATQHNADAEFGLGMIYKTGYSGKDLLDYKKKAAYWLRKASDQGQDLAPYSLAILYEEGNGITQSYADAYFWYSLVVRSHGQNAAEAETARNSIKKHLSKQQVSRLERRVRRWKPVPETTPG